MAATRQPWTLLGSFVFLVSSTGSRCIGNGRLLWLPGLSGVWRVCRRQDRRLQPTFRVCWLSLGHLGLHRLPLVWGQWRQAVRCPFCRLVLPGIGASPRRTGWWSAHSCVPAVRRTRSCVSSRPFVTLRRGWGVCRPSRALSTMQHTRLAELLGGWVCPAHRSLPSRRLAWIWVSWSALLALVPSGPPLLRRWWRLPPAAGVWGPRRFGRSSAADLLVCGLWLCVLGAGSAAASY